MQKFECPSRRDLKLLLEWLDRPEGGNFFLRGREAEIWQVDKDLIALSARREGIDSLTELIDTKVIPWYHRWWGYQFKVMSTVLIRNIRLRLFVDSRSLPLAKIGTAYGTMNILSWSLLLMLSVPSFHLYYPPHRSSCSIS